MLNTMNHIKKIFLLSTLLLNSLYSMDDEAQIKLRDERKKLAKAIFNELPECDQILIRMEITRHIELKRIAQKNRMELERIFTPNSN
ncbi:hypothetical protein M1446_04835 [Candidatus Dependentiae bacterium]|nr:hypothetical protein [Candidatus Dependentiae bacterium]